MASNQETALDLLTNADISGWGNSKPFKGAASVWNALSGRGPAEFKSPISKSREANVGLHKGIVNAGGMLASDTYCKAEHPGSGLVRYTDKVFISEYHHQDGSVSFVEYNAEAKTIAGSLVEGIDTPTPSVNNLPTLNKAKKTNLTAIYLCLIAYLLTVEEENCRDILRDYFNNMKADLEGTGKPELGGKHVYGFSDTIYWALKRGIIPIENIKGDGNLPRLDVDSILSGKYAGAEVWAGDPKYLMSAGSGTKRKKERKKGPTIQSVRELPEIQAYVAARNNWTDEEREWIPQYPEDTPVPDEVVECAKVIVLSANSKRPVLNLAWRGTSGFGKSTGVEMLAAILQRPLLRLTCSSTMEREQFLTEIMPDTTPRKADVNISFEEIACDPEGAYEQLTGKSVPGISCNEVFAEAIRAAAAANSTMPRYVMRESTYIRALKYGYICEVQESSRIRDAGVLPGLNEYDRPGALIPQVDGSFARRHPDAIVFYTDNVGYNSCNELDPSVIRRIAYIIDSTDLPMEKAVARVMANTGVKDKTLISSMYNVWKKVQDHCKDNDLLAAGGCVTIEELERWVQMTDLLGLDQIGWTCIRTVVSKATTDYDEQKNIISGVVGPALSAEHLG